MNTPRHEEKRDRHGSPGSADLLLAHLLVDSAINLGNGDRCIVLEFLAEIFPSGCQPLAVAAPRSVVLDEGERGRSDGPKCLASDT
jgi:hypothetical protein